MDIHRLRVVLHMTARATLHYHQAGELYALMAYVNGMASGIESAMPDGLLLEAPEQARLNLSADHEYAFGFTYLAGSPEEAKGRLKRLIAALKEAGGTRGKPGAVFSNNFRVVRVDDLIAGHPFDGTSPPTPLPVTHIQSEIERLRTHMTSADAPSQACNPVTLRFTNLLRFHRPKSDQGAGHGFADETWFNPHAFLDRADSRQKSLGIQHQLAAIDRKLTEATPTSVPVNRVALQSNDLTWLDLSYGFAGARKHLGGALGTVTLTGLSPADVERLVWGQYVHVGDNTRYGYGRYRIVELGPDPFPCERSSSLLRLALKPGAIDEAAERYGVDAGTCAELVRQVARGVYQPEPHQRVTITSGSRSRELSIPAKNDRVLQRAVYDFLAQPLDKLLEADSFAYRRGLGRHDAARRLKRSVAEGFRWALRADIDDFFDTIDHAKLVSRVRAYLADDALSDLILDWVRTGAPQPGRGIPTGAVISPLLANLFLDRFDERIAQTGGRLVRYADDFLILYRTEAAAQAAHQRATESAAELALKLNEDNTKLVDLHEPFTFLGFRFQRDLEWTTTDTGPPRQVEELGWFDVGSQRDEATPAIQLPGECAAATGGDRATLILGPGLRWLGARDGKLRYGYGEGGTESGSVSFERLEQVLVIGTPTIYEELILQLAEHPVQVLVLDDWCRPRVRLGPVEESGTADLIRAQVELISNAERSLEVSRSLIAAKLRNHATLADAAPGRKHDGTTGPLLRERVEQVLRAQTLPELMGSEGSAAALWYSRLSERLPSEFSFERRVAPHANDPVNILLNISQTLLHRLIAALLGGQGLNPHLSCLHQSRAGHASLASDLQEPFRHLMDRAALEGARRLLPTDFTTIPDRRPRPVWEAIDPDHSNSATHSMRMRPAAARRYLEQVHRLLALRAPARGQRDPVSYRIQVARTVRSFKQHVLHPEQPFVPFEH